LKVFKSAALGFVLLAAVSAFPQQDSSLAPTDKPAAQGEATTQQTPAPVPTPLPIPSTVGPLQLSPPINFEAGLLGKLSLNGAASGIGLFQNNAVPGNNPQEGAFTNAFLFLQKAEGWFQFFVQAGAYDLPSLGTAFYSNATANSDLFGPVPVVFGKIVVSKNTNLVFGVLPTLLGGESTFDFQDMNIQRGLLWNQTNAISRGVQLNQTLGKLTASFSYNDGYYSNRYNWLTGALTYTRGPHSVMFTAGGTLGSTSWRSLATPIQNNSMLFD
jgi:Putative beta-barrel porin-2, OmpL-like. bbp2